MDEDSFRKAQIKYFLFVEVNGSWAESISGTEKYLCKENKYQAVPKLLSLIPNEWKHCASTKVNSCSIWKYLAAKLALILIQTTIKNPPAQKHA